MSDESMGDELKALVNELAPLVSALAAFGVLQESKTLDDFPEHQASYDAIEDRVRELMAQIAKHRSGGAQQLSYRLE